LFEVDEIAQGVLAQFDSVFGTEIVDGINEIAAMYFSSIPTVFFLQPGVGFFF
jgi:hypothetical protein